MRIKYNKFQLKWISDGLCFSYRDNALRCYEIWFGRMAGTILLNHEHKLWHIINTIFVVMQQIMISRNSRINYWLILATGIAIRIALTILRFHEVVERRVEVVSPVTSWYRVKECLMLSSLSISPYSGDICHQPPLLVALFRFVPSQHTEPFFVLIDVLTGVVLHKFATIFAHTQLQIQRDELPSYAKETTALLIKNTDHIPEVVMAIYLLCPFTVLNCLAHSTIVLNNFISAVMLLAMSAGWLVMASVCVALLTYFSLYPVVLIIPVCLCVSKVPKRSAMLLKLSQCISIFIIALYILLLTSANTDNGSWDFVSAVYGFVLKAPDLTPNMGLCWYFFLEMFDHFRLFFLCVYQINVFIYAIPLAIVFRRHPFLVFYSLLSLTALLKSYSNFGDLSTPLAMLPLWSFVYTYMRNSLIVCCMLFFTTILAPLMWQVWIYTGAGNANFFYAVTLIYSTAQVFLLSDVLYAFLRRQYHLKNGIKPNVSKDGKEHGHLVMK